MALVALSLLKQFLGKSLSSTSEDAQLSAMLTAAEATVKSYCNQEFEVKTYTEYYHGTGTKLLVLRKRPVRSITSIHFDWDGFYGTNPDGSFAATTLLTSGVDYALDLDGSWNNLPISYSGMVVRLKHIWPEVARRWFPGYVTAEVAESRGSIKVVYSAGYDPIPEELQYACCYLVSYMLRTAGLGAAVHSEKIGNYSYELTPARWMSKEPEISTVRQILGKYRDQSI